MHIFKVLDICGQAAHKMGNSFISQTLISSVMRRLTSISQSNYRDTNYIFPKRWVGKSLWRRQRLPTSVFWPGEFHGLYSLCGCKQSDKNEGFSLSLSLYTCSTLLKVLVAQSCPTLCDRMDFNLPGSSVPGILQASILKWVVIFSSRASSQPRDRICISCIRWILYFWDTRESTLLLSSIYWGRNLPPPAQGSLSLGLCIPALPWPHRFLLSVVFSFSVSSFHNENVVTCQRHRCGEQMYGHQGGKRGGGMNWETGVDMCTLLTLV